MLFDYLVLPLAFLPLVIGFVRGKDHFVPGLLEDDLDKDFSGIRCPSCGMTTAWAHLLRSPGCGEVWNTFATRGECPGCQRRWPSTQCTRCGVWSDHDAWYEERPQPRR